MTLEDGLVISIEGCLDAQLSRDCLRFFVTTRPHTVCVLTNLLPSAPIRLWTAYPVGVRRVGWGAPSPCHDGGEAPVRWVARGGRCGGAAPAQGRPLAADRPEYKAGRKHIIARLVQGCELVAAESLHFLEEMEAFRFVYAGSVRVRGSLLNVVGMDYERLYDTVMDSSGCNIFWLDGRDGDAMPHWDFGFLNRDMCVDSQVMVENGIIVPENLE